MKFRLNRSIFYRVGIALALVLVAASVETMVRGGPDSSLLVKQGAPYHARYAKTTQLIEKRDYAKALKEARALRVALEGDKQLWNEGQSGRVLYAFNLLRIAQLQREIGTPQEESLALSDLEMVAVTDQETAQLLEQSFRIGEVSLSDYIKNRKLALKRES
jgi:hypothetical protein